MKVPGDPTDYLFLDCFVAPQSVTLEMAIKEVEFWFHWMDRCLPDREVRGFFEDVAELQAGNPHGRQVRWADDLAPQPARDFGITDGISGEGKHT